MKSQWLITAPVRLALAGVLAWTAGAYAAGDPIKIGVPTALTGTYASLGAEVVHAVQFAVDEANASGGVDGRKVEMKVLDTEGNPENARRQGEKLALDGYKFLIGAPLSGEGLALVPMLDRWDALYISTINKADRLTGDACSARFFRSNQEDSQDAAVLKPWLATRKETRWAILAADIAWGRDTGNSFKEAARADHKQIVSEAYSPFGANDYAAFIQQIKASGAQAVWIGLAGKDSINFVSQAKQFGLLNTVFVSGTAGFISDTAIKTLGDAWIGVGGVLNYTTGIDTPQNRTFVAAWKKAHHGDEPTNYEAATYIGMQTLLQAVARAHSVKPIDVARTLEGGTFDTLLGATTIRAQDHQFELPDYAGSVVKVNGKLSQVVSMTVPAAQVLPPLDPACKKALLVSPKS
jgi:branched-chain amino acid transport system substrate-binding protein